MSLQLLTHTNIPFSCFKTIDRANIVQTSTGNKAARWGISTGHDPARPQRDSMNLEKKGLLDKTNNNNNQENKAEMEWHTKMRKVKQEKQIQSRLACKAIDVNFKAHPILYHPTPACANKIHREPSR